jgi:serine/threonine protein kinase
VGVEALCALIALSGADHAPLTPQTLRIDEAGQVEISPADRSGAAAAAGAKYAAPDALGRGAPASPAARVQADLYALGFILYELLLGRDRFAREFPGADDGGEPDWVDRRRDPMRKPRPAAQVVEGVPAAASALLDRLLEPAPEQRFTSYKAALDAIGELLHDLNRAPGRPKGSTTAAASRRSCRGLAIGSVGIAALALVLAALAARLMH